MTKRAVTTTAPRLRFPESMSDSWELKSLEEIAPLQRGFDLPSSDLEPGEIPVVYSNGVQHFHSTAMARAPGLVTGRSGTIGKIHFIESGEYWPHNTSLWVTSFKGNVPKFVYYLFNAIGMGRFASGSGVPTLNRNDVHAFLGAVPSSLAEQQKIADCLTSLDNVIAAQVRKVEALKVHKRGLMQQLFAREGESGPRLRFPEFGDAPGWKADQVSKLISTVTPPRKIPTSGYGAEGRLPIVDQSPDPICGWTDDLDATVDAPLPLIVFGDHTCVLKLVNHAFAQGADGIKIISNLPRIEVRFLYYALQADPLSSAAYQRHFSLLQEKRVAFPEDLVEQRCIADCFSSLDAQITAESRHHAALKTHRRGLMQQLFPFGEGAL